VLSQLTAGPGPVLGRVVGVVTGPEANLAGIATLRKMLAAEGVQLRVIGVIGVTGGTLGTGKNAQIIERTLLTTRSVEYDAVLIADGTGGLRDPRLTVLLQEAFRHCKALGAWGDGMQVLQDAGIDTTAPGILVGEKTTTAASALSAELLGALTLHRVWDRAPLLPT